MCETYATPDKILATCNMKTLTKTQIGKTFGTYCVKYVQHPDQNVYNIRLEPTKYFEQTSETLPTCL
jgi:hypothetical protein